MLLGSINFINRSRWSLKGCEEGNGVILSGDYYLKRLQIMSEDVFRIATNDINSKFARDLQKKLFLVSYKK
jgi:hypothetical protein